MRILWVTGMSFLLSFLQKPLVDFGWQEAEYTWIGLFVYCGVFWLLAEKDSQARRSKQ